MRKEIQVKNCKDLTNWDEAIQDIERKLKHTEARTKRLKAAIETFKAHKAMGRPWPGDIAGTDGRAVPS